MPIYEYICKSCGHEFEDIAKSVDAPNPACFQCDSFKTEKLPSAHGGYLMSSGGSSTRPKGAGSFRKEKKE